MLQQVRVVGGLVLVSQRLVARRILEQHQPIHDEHQTSRCLARCKQKGDLMMMVMIAIAVAGIVAILCVAMEDL